ncbi:hypothetical protein F5X99DRAFT_404096 [Biscogniauxia marginata]|nr:hypothetical protein F5X99DRAFT_404096 [Biscogniauxia marginata]
MAAPEPAEPSKSVISRLEAWGNSSLAPTGLATLVTALHFRPLQVRPMLFAPALLFSSYANLQGFRIDSAGITAAASGAYALLALRRRSRSLRSRFSVRGGVRGAAIALGVVNTLAAGWVYATSDREREVRERKENPRWAA